MSNAAIITQQGSYPFLTITDHEFLKQCIFDPYLASGPGGQKRNRTYSAVRITHKPTGLAAVAEESRSQHENRVRTLRRLKILIALRVRANGAEGWFFPEALQPYFKPVLQKMNPGNERYALFCAAMLDLLYQKRGSLSASAAELGISTGQCGPLFMLAKDIMAEANAIRASFGLRPLKQRTSG
jgi:hypothetical protein